jgi:hypothetical protein
VRASQAIEDVQPLGATQALQRPLAIALGEQLLLVLRQQIGLGDVEVDVEQDEIDAAMPRECLGGLAIVASRRQQFVLRHEPRAQLPVLVGVVDDEDGGHG